MSSEIPSTGPGRRPANGLWHRLRERGVLRVATSYAVIAWLVLEIASVVFEPLGVPMWVMTALIIAAAVGFPLAIALAWFLEIGEHGVGLDTAAEGMPRPTVRGVRHYVDAIVIGVLLITVAILLVRQSDIGKPKPPESPGIAVLPFENLSGDPAQEYFSDGLAEDVLDRLGRVPGLRVIARASSFSFKGRDVDPKTIAGQLGVTTMLEGSVRRDGQRLKLTTRLIDGATGQQVWSGSFDREVTDVFAVQAELARAVVDAIVPTARGAPAENPAAPTTDLNAYDLYLLARTQKVIRTQNSIRKSVELAEQAVRLDPNFAQAQALLGNARVFLALSDEDLVTEQIAPTLRAAEVAIHRALALDPDLSEAHQAYGNLLRTTQRPGAEDEYKRALELNPNNAAAWHDYAYLLSGFPDRQQESWRATERALELDPRQPTTWANYLSHVGWERFQELFPRVLAMIGDMPFAIDRITMPEAAVMGYPVEVMMAGLAKVRMQAEDNLPPWLNFCRVWISVDLERAEHYLTRNGGVHHGVDFENVRLFIEAEVFGLKGDWAALERELATLTARVGEDHVAVRSLRAFWHIVQGRLDEALALGAIEAAPWIRGIPPLLNTDADWSQMDAARIRLLRGTGRESEAHELASELLETLRPKRGDGDSNCHWMGWLRYAAIAASAGINDEAIAALEAAMKCGILPYAFQPQLPWFQSLEGDPRYSEILRERARRVETIRHKLLQLEADERQLLVQPY